MLLPGLIEWRHVEIVGCFDIFRFANLGDGQSLSKAEDQQSTARAIGSPQARLSTGLSRTAAIAQLAAQNANQRRCVDTDLRNMAADSKKRNRDVLANTHGLATLPTSTVRLVRKT